MILEKFDLEYSISTIDNLRTLVEDTRQKMLRDPSYDGYADISRTATKIDKLKHLIELEKSRAGLTGLSSPERARIQRLLIKITDLLKMVEITQQKMLRKQKVLQNLSYGGPEELIHIKENLDVIYTNLKEELRL